MHLRAIALMGDSTQRALVHLLNQGRSELDDPPVEGHRRRCSPRAPLQFIAGVAVGATLDQVDGQPDEIELILPLLLDEDLLPQGDEGPSFATVAHAGGRHLEATEARDEDPPTSARTSIPSSAVRMVPWATQLADELPVPMLQDGRQGLPPVPPIMELLRQRSKRYLSVPLNLVRLADLDHRAV